MKKNLKVILCVLVVYALAAVIGSARAIEIDTSSTELEIDTYKAQGHRSSLWDEDVFKGFQEYYRRNFNNAILFLEKAYNSGCRDGLVLYRLALCYASSDRCEEVVFYGEQAISKLKENYPNHYYNQNVYQLIGHCSRNIDKTIEFYLKGLERDSSDVSTRLNMSYKLIEAGRLDEAERQINIVLQEYSDVTAPYGHGVAYNGLGQIYYKRGDYQKAVSAFKKALDYRNMGVDAWWLAISYEALKDYEQAAKYWKLAAEIYGEDSEWGRKALKRLNEIKGLR